MSNAPIPMTNEDNDERGSAHDRNESDYDLSERTAVFGEEVIGFARKIKADPVTSPLITQLVRAATSVGANYDEADEAATKKDFRYRISVCKKEARETKRWIRMTVVAVPTLKHEARTLWQEANELHLIFAAIFRNSGDNDK
ncbi:MAG: four helix bundle protein [Planctomycetota bacterium]|nr:four helix bundle protein [Planctomycetota bacterium]